MILWAGKPWVCEILILHLVCILCRSAHSHYGNCSPITGLIKRMNCDVDVLQDIHLPFRGFTTAEQPPKQSRD